MRIIYINGVIDTITNGLKEAFVVENKKFIYVGSTKEALQYQTKESQIVDLQQKYVTAGFNDSHMHVLNYGYTLTMCPLAKVKSITELKQTLKAYIQKEKITKGAFVKGRGWNHDFFEDEKRFPTRQDLDEVSLDHPILITRTCGHIAICNTKALEIFDIDENTPQVEGGYFDVKTGVFKENAIDLINAKMPQPTVEQIKEMLKRAFKSLNQYGITSAQSDDLLVFENYHDILEAYHQLEQEQAMSVKIYEQSHFTSLESLKQFIDEGYHTGVGNDYFKIGPLKMMADGSLGARTALLLEPYQDDQTTKGIQVYDTQTLNEMVDYASTHGMQVAIHAIGDGALEMVLQAYENTLAKHPRSNHRHGVVHCQISNPSQLERFKNLQLQAYIQSIFLDYDVMIVEDRVGKRANSSYAFKTFYDFNHASNGSDCPVELPDVLKGMQCAITRCSTKGIGPYLLNQALHVHEALQSFTLNGAYASFEEKVKGSIEVGKVADFVVLSENLHQIDPFKFVEVDVLKTYVDGNCVYAKEE